ncbi:MAG: flagellar export chaperone FliS [Gammaproteobacteria bacterium]|nr:flagellar export chaperone FliS [Gammaproteobacteria bacterium]
MNSYSGANAYQQVDRFSAIEGASPHHLTSMLMQGAIDSIAVARGMMERRDFAGKAKLLGKTIAILTELQSSLDMEEGGEIANNLHNLYDYMTRTVLLSSMENKPEKLDEVSGLLGDLLEAWNSIPASQRRG